MRAGDAKWHDGRLLPPLPSYGTGARDPERTACCRLKWHFWPTSTSTSTSTSTEEGRRRFPADAGAPLPSSMNGRQYMGRWFRPAIDYPVELVDNLPGQGIGNPYWLCRCWRCAARMIGIYWCYRCADARIAKRQAPSGAGGGSAPPCDSPPAGRDRRRKPNGGRRRRPRPPYLPALARDRNSISIACSMSACVLVSSCAAMTRSCRATSGVT